MEKDILTTSRLILRKVREDDVDAVFKNWASDPEVTKNLTWNTHQSIDETKRIMDVWLKEYEDSKTVRYGITLKDSDELIGMIDIVNRVDGNPEIGYCLCRKYWNKGFMTEACKALLDHLFATGYKTIVIEALEDNIGSNRVIEKCGFKFTHKQTRLCSSFKPVMVTVNWYKKSI